MNKYSDLFLDEPKVSTSKYSDLFLDEPEEEEVLEGERPPLASLVSKPWLAKVMEKGEEFAYNIMRDVPGFAASFPMMMLPPPVRDVVGLIGKATEPIREKVEGFPFLAPLRDLEERAFGEKAVGEPLFEPEVLPQSQQEQIYNILKPLITGEVSVPEAALGVVESTPVVGAVPRAIRDPESLLERPLPYLMDLAILLGGVGALAKGKRTRIKPVEAKAVPPSPRAEPPDIFPGLREKVVPEIAPGPPEGIMEAVFGLEKPKVKPKKIVVGKEEQAAFRFAQERIKRGIGDSEAVLKDVADKYDAHTAVELEPRVVVEMVRVNEGEVAARAVKSLWDSGIRTLETHKGAKETTIRLATVGNARAAEVVRSLGGRIKTHELMGDYAIIPSKKLPLGAAELALKRKLRAEGVTEEPTKISPRREADLKVMADRSIGEVEAGHPAGRTFVWPEEWERGPIKPRITADASTYPQWYRDLTRDYSIKKSQAIKALKIIKERGMKADGRQYVENVKASLLDALGEERATYAQELLRERAKRGVLTATEKELYADLERKAIREEPLLTEEVKAKPGAKGIELPGLQRAEAEAITGRKIRKVTGTKAIKEEMLGRPEGEVLPGQRALKAAAKEPWEMTREDYRYQRLKKISESPTAPGGYALAVKDFYDLTKRPLIEKGMRETFWKFDAEHKNAVKQAIIDKKPVPEPVLAEYPELGKKGRIGAKLEKKEPVELGFLGTPEAAKALGESVVGGAREISRLTSEMTEKMKVKPEIRAGVKEAKESMIEHDRQTRRAESTSKLFEKVIKDVVPDKGRQMEMVHAYEHKMKGPYWEGLTDLEQSMVEWISKEKAKLNKFIEENEVLEMMPESENINHIFHHWINPETGVPYKGMYGKFSKGLPQAKQRVIPTYESGIKKGLKPATTNIGKLVGLEWEAATRAHQSREMFKTLHNIGAEKGAEIQLMKGKPAKPIRMVERWDLLGKQGLTEDYVRYSHPALDKAIIFKDANGMLVKLKGAVGVRKELFPFVKAYLESPNYGSLSKLNFATKSLKLGFSMFHVMSLGMQELANFRIPFKNIPRGLREVRNLGPELRLLHQEGLELFKGYEDIGYRNKFFEGAETWKKAGNFVTKPIEGMRTFIFDIVQPGMKASFALDKYNELLPKYLKRGMTKEQCARDVVKAADGHFSGEHYKRSLLETNRFMAKMYFSPQARKTWQAALLSPTWQREHLLVAKNVAKSFMPDRFIRKIGLSEIGPIKGEFRKYLLGATMLIGAVDLWNMYLTHKMDGEAKHLWQNPEGKGFAIRAPWNEPGYEVEVKDDKGNVKLKKDGQPMIRRVKGGPGYIRPLKSVFEVAEWVKTPFKKFIYKLSPIVTATGRQFWPSKYQKEYKGWPDMPRRAWDFVTDVGTPISASQIGSWAMGKKTPQAAAIPFFGFPTSKLSIKQTNKIYYERLAAIQKKHGRYSDEWRKVKVEFEDMGYKFSEKSYRAYWEEKKEPTRGLLGIFGMP